MPNWKNVGRSVFLGGIFCGLGFMGGDLLAATVSDLSGTVPSSDWQFKTKVSLGYQPEGSAPNGAFVFEPSLQYLVSERDSLVLYSAFERPTNPYVDTKIPKMMAAWLHPLDGIKGFETTLQASLSGLNLSDWRSDGYQIRPSLSLNLAQVLSPGLRFAFRMGGFGQLNRYRQTLGGSEIPMGGFNERLSLSYDVAKISAGVAVMAEQGYGFSWQNNFATQEFIAYQLHSQVSIGLAHSLVSELVDDTQGSYDLAAHTTGTQNRVACFFDFTF